MASTNLHISINYNHKKEVILKINNHIIVELLSLPKDKYLKYFLYIFRKNENRKVPEFLIYTI